MASLALLVTLLDVPTPPPEPEPLVMVIVLPEYDPLTTPLWLPDDEHKS